MLLHAPRPWIQGALGTLLREVTGDAVKQHCLLN